MTYIPTARVEWTVESIFDTSLAEGSGAYLRYEPIYDEIKEARREDDPQLSQGVWQTDLKRANWVAVEHLCVEALTHKTRDLQLALWLCDALVAMDGPSGLIRGLQLVYAMSERFWDSFYPTDEDFRIPLWEWSDQELHKRLILLPITRRGYNYSDWQNALNIESIRQRAAHRVPSGAITIARIRKDLEHPARPFRLDQLDALELIINQLRDLLNAKTDNAPGFTVFRRTLQDIRPLCKPVEKEEEVVVSAQPSVSEEDEAPSEVPAGGDAPVLISERSHAYQAIRDIGAFLANLDPHSPVPQLLLMAGGWESFSLPQILADIQNKPETKALMRMLGGDHSF